MFCVLVCFSPWKSRIFFFCYSNTSYLDWNEHEIDLFGYIVWFYLTIFCFIHYCVCVCVCVEQRIKTLTSKLTVFVIIAHHCYRDIQVCFSFFFSLFFLLILFPILSLSWSKHMDMVVIIVCPCVNGFFLSMKKKWRKQKKI